MKTYLILILALASALLAGCDKESGADGAPGQVRLSCRASERIVIAGVHKLNAGEKIKAVDQQAYR